MMKIIKSMRSLWLGALLLVSVLVHASPMVIIQGDRLTAEEPKNSYRAELYQMILEATRAEYGDYEIRSNTTSNGAALRLANLISDGTPINLLWASPGTPIAKAKVIEIPVDIMYGLMGYRICITSKKKSEILADIKNADDLNHKIHVLQGAGWADIAMYNFNHINVGTGDNFEGLFAMVASGHYECLPLGADEVGYILSPRHNHFPDLIVDKHLLIYYEYPIYLYVSKKNPVLAERIKKGLAIVQSNGEMRKLFNRYYKNIANDLQLDSRHRLCLRSPYLPSEGQCSGQTVN